MQNSYRVFKWTLVAVGLCGWCAGIAWGTILAYEMDVAPDDASLGTAAMTKVGGGFGDPAVDFDAGPQITGAPAGSAGLQGDGTARFIDSGNYARAGFYKTGLGNVFTVDMRVMANWSIGGNTITGGANGASGMRSMAITNGNAEGVLNSGPGVEIRLSSPANRGIQLAGWNGSAEVKSSPTWVNTNPTLAGFHNVRFSMNNTTLTIYDLENDADPGPGVNYAVFLTTDMAAAGIQDAGADAAISGTAGGGGFQINSMEATGTRTGWTDFSLDWLRISTGTALGATDPVIVPEPASLGILSLGMIGLMWRRRRA